MSKQFSSILLVNNGGIENIERRLNEIPNIQILGDGHNLGLAKALNLGCKTAIERGSEWAVTLDQDSLLHQNYLDSQISAIKTSSDIKIIGCRYTDNHECQQAGDDRIATSTTIITSGMMLNLKIWDFVGKFREDFFIDAIDHEFCLRAKTRSIDTYKNKRILMTHKIGNQGKLGFHVYHRDPERRYSSARNTTITVISLGAVDILWSLKRALSLTLEIPIILFLEERPFTRLKKHFKGILDGLSRVKAKKT